MATLTKRQKQIYDYIKKYIRKNGISPTFEEIKRHMRLKALSTISEHVEELIEKGFIVKNGYGARSIEIVKNKKFDLVQIPLLGTIAAGQPIKAIEIPSETITVSKDEVGEHGKNYALRVQGNSMIDEGIFDGDIVIIRKQEYADNGQMVVAIIDDDEATLKKLYKEKNQIRLQPANPTLFPIYRKEVEIRGVVVKIIRNLETQIEKEKVKDEKYARRVDYSWDYKGEKTKSYTHGIHTYPAMFIPQVARRLLENYSQVREKICDIFCGSGTALVESKLLGRNAYGIDLNPLAIFLAKAKTTPINPSTLTKEYFKLLARIEKIKDAEIEKPNFNNIDFWFKEKSIIQLAKIKKAISEVKDENIRNYFMVSFSETVRLSSNTKSGEFKLVRIKKEK